MTFESRFTDEQMAAILDEYKGGANRRELRARYGLSVRTLFRWQARIGASRPALLELVSTLRDENTRLRDKLRETQTEPPDFQR